MCVSGETYPYSREEMCSVHKKQAGTIVGQVVTGATVGSFIVFL
jgi:hypothetical protein